MAVDLSKLNAAQREAATHRDGPVLLVAGAGTGKTTVVTNRIAWLIAEGIAKVVRGGKGFVEKGKIRIKDFSWKKVAEETLKVYGEADIQVEQNLS